MGSDTQLAFGVKFSRDSKFSWGDVEGNVWGRNCRGWVNG